MSSALTADVADIEYPESDGLPMADNTKQAFWMAFLFFGFCAMYRKQEDVFVAMNLFWYPVEGAPKIRAAPDVMIALGRPKGDRGSYQQWREGGIAPQVAIEIRSPGNTDGEIRDKLAFYERYGVQEYYFFDPDTQELTVYLRQADRLVEQTFGEVWHSPLLDVRFDVREDVMKVIDVEGREFQSLEEVMVERDEIAVREKKLAAERDEVAAERDRLLAQLRAAGIEPKP